MNLKLISFLPAQGPLPPKKNKSFEWKLCIIGLLCNYYNQLSANLTNVTYHSQFFGQQDFSAFCIGCLEVEHCVDDVGLWRWAASCHRHDHCLCLQFWFSDQKFPPVWFLRVVIMKIIILWAKSTWNWQENRTLSLQDYIVSVPHLVILSLQETGNFMHFLCIAQQFRYLFLVKKSVTSFLKMWKFCNHFRPWRKSNNMVLIENVVGVGSHCLPSFICP
jgi:hypothetical protein